LKDDILVSDDVFNTVQFLLYSLFDIWAKHLQRSHCCFEWWSMPVLWSM